MSNPKYKNAVRRAKRLKQKAQLFRIVPRYDNGAIRLYLPDLEASSGRIACYSKFGEHSEANLHHYRYSTRPCASGEELIAGTKLAEWYKATFDYSPDDMRIVRSFNTRGRK